MKMIYEFAALKKEMGLEYLAGVPAAEKRQIGRASCRDRVSSPV